MPTLSLTPQNSFVVLIDVQERLLAAMPSEVAAQVVARADVLLEGARLLGVPVVVTEQYPKGLGPTAAPLLERLASFGGAALAEPVVEKLAFDGTADPKLEAHLERFRAEGRTAAIIGGLEAHICVYQTARGLGERGFTTHVALDATGARKSESVDVARQLWGHAGAIETTTEVVLFDWLGRAGGETFKAISRLVR